MSNLEACKQCNRKLKSGSHVTLIMSISGWVGKNYTVVDQLYDALDADQFEVEAYCKTCKP